MPDGSQLAGRCAVTFFADQTASTKHQLLCSLDELAQNIRMKCWPDKASMHWLKLAVFGDQRTENNSLRSNVNVTAVTGAAGDYDGGPMTIEQAMSLVWEARVKAILYTTPSNTDDKPHWRLLCPTSIPLPRERRADLVDRLNGLIGGGFAPESWVLSQAYYFGSIEGKPPVQVEIIDGQDCRFIDQASDIAGIPKPGGKSSDGTATPMEDNDPTAPITDLARYAEQISNDDRPWEEWNTVLMAFYAASGGSDLGLQLAYEWSAKSEKKNDPAAVDERWKHYRTSPPNRIGAGMLARMARDEEWIRTIGAEKLAQYAAVAGTAGTTCGGPWGGTAASASEQDLGKPFPMTENDLFDMPDPTPLVVGLLMQNENVCLVGKPKAGKTFVALDIGLSIAAGLPVLGHLPVKQQGPVVYLAAEGKAGFKRRIKAWRQARGITPDIGLPFYFKGAVPMTAAGVTETKRYIDGIRQQIGEPVVVIVDTMARSLNTMNENEASSAAAYLNLTETIRGELNTTMLTLAHASDKEQAKPIGIRGSSGFGAGFDSVWTLAMNAANRTAKLEALYLKDGDPDDFGPWFFKREIVWVEGMENGKGAVLRLVPASEFQVSGETSIEDERCTYMRQALIAAGNQRFSTNQLAEYLVGWDKSQADPYTGVKTAQIIYNEDVEADRLAKSKKLDWLKYNGSERKGRPAVFAEFVVERAYPGASRVTREWRCPPEYLEPVVA